MFPLLVARTLAVALNLPVTGQTTPLDQPANTWVKRSPLPGGPPSPRLGYEGACAWDSKHRVLIRYGGHNQGGGGEQHAEVWTFDPATARWQLKETNTSPPGICCGQQNVYDPIRGRYIRFPAFSGSHGWQWSREIYLNDSSVWTFDLTTNTWRNMRPLPAPSPRPLRCASWDSHAEVVVLFGGEGSHEGTLVYDPHSNTWTRKNPPLEPDPRSGGNMTYDAARRLHILFGSQFTDDPHTWAYDLSKNKWRDLKPTTTPHTDKNDAVLTYDPVAKKVLAIVKISEGKEDHAKSRLESWAFDAGTNEWQKLNPPQEPDASGNRARVLQFAPELGLAILENRTHPPHGPAEQQIWTYRFAGRTEPASDLATQPVRAPSGPPVVDDFVVSVVAAQRVELSWKPPAGGKVAGYAVFRAPVDVLSEDQLKRLKSRTPPLDPPAVGAIRRIGPFRRLNELPVPEPKFVDTAIDLSRPAPSDGEPAYERSFPLDQFDPVGTPCRLAVYTYRVVAFDAAGRASGPSPAVFTIPSPPQFAFAKEEGTTCHLRWAANPERAIRGYRVYRMDGRWDKDAITRLTPEPITATTFADAQAGKPTRRYYVVAVDVLGQEGMPSSPVWFNREWKPFYAPFTGDWHQ